MSTFLFLVVVGVVAWLWFRARAGSAPAQLPAVERSERIGGEGGFDQEVVGESNYQRALRAACGPGEVRHECEAVLFLEDDNPYDKKAVMVTVDGRCVGYLTREDARAYRRKFKRFGKFAGFCPAKIFGGGQGKDNVGIWLDLDLG
jgi:hypothetical protein